MTIRPFGSNSFSTNGPVPLACRDAKFSSPALTFTGTRASCAVAQPSDMMAMSRTLSHSCGSGNLVSMRTVCSSTARTSAMLSMRPAKPAGSSVLARAKLNTTSAAVNGVPSWKRTFGRSSNSQVVGSTSRHAMASWGTRFQVGIEPDQALVDLTKLGRGLDIVVAHAGRRSAPRPRSPSAARFPPQPGRRPRNAVTIVSPAKNAL